MSYKVDFDSLDSMNNSIGSQANTWLSELEEIKNKFQVLIDSTNMAGEAADNIKNYIINVHMTLIGLLSQLVSMHSSNCLLYKSDYQINVDSDLHSVIKSTELLDYKGRVDTTKATAISIDESISYVLSGIKDIFQVSYSDITGVDNLHISVSSFLSGIDEDINSLENNHYNNDFINTTQMINVLKTFINEQTSSDRTYRTNFSTDNLYSSASFLQLYNTHMDVNKEMEDKASSIQSAIDNENSRVAALQKEYEERQKEAEKVNWIAAGACVIISIAAVVVTAGAATPVVIATTAAVGAVTGGIMAGTSSIMNQYVEFGGVNNWGSVFSDAATGAIIGGITGAVGSTIGAAGSAATKVLVPANSMGRIATGAFIGGVSEVTSGVATRGISSYISTGDVDVALEEAFDGKKMLIDGALGTASGGVQQYTSIKQAQKASDAAASSYNMKNDPLGTGKENGLENLKVTKNGGVDFSDSDYILRDETGKPIQITIKSTGSRAKDYKLAEKMLKEEYGYDIDFKSMRTGDNRTHVWHHMDDYNVMKNETTMQFIEIDAHQSIGKHSGSANQYHVAHGTGYNKQAIKREYDGVSVSDFINPVRENFGEYVETINSYKGKVFGVSNSSEFEDLFPGFKVFST